jgi:hypothetical protein
MRMRQLWELCWLGWLRRSQGRVTFFPVGIRRQYIGGFQLAHKSITASSTCLNQPGLFGTARSASLSLLTATARRWSKSTKVSSAQRRSRSSSRVTTSPADSNSTARTEKGCSCSPTLLPSLRSSPARGLASKLANRIHWGEGRRHQRTSHCSKV